ncbi:uncharacterized protein LOC144341739 [Saccoglossus kowalevskii]
MASSQLNPLAKFIEYIGGEIKNDELKGMKRLSKDYISENKIDRCTDAAELLTALAENGKISATNMDVLIAMLPDMNRAALVEDVEEFVNKQKQKGTSSAAPDGATNQNKMPSTDGNPDFAEFALKLGRDISKSELADMKILCQGQLGKGATEGLNAKQFIMKLKEVGLICPEKGDYSYLGNLLRNADRKDLADKLPRI